MLDSFLNEVDQIVEAFPIGVPSAVKRGRRVEWPYVALLTNYLGKPGMTHNPMGRRAYATREEAVQAAERYVTFWRAGYRAKLLDPRYRALREHHGLARELPVLENV